RGTRVGSGVRAETGRGRGQLAGVAAGQWRAGARNRGSVDPVQRGGHHRGGLGGGAGAAGGTGRRYGRCADGVAGAADVASATQADGDRIEIEDLPDFHQPDSREDRGDVWESRDDDRRAGAEILFVDPRGYPAHSIDQGRRPGDWIPNARDDREYKGG